MNCFNLQLITNVNTCQPIYLTNPLFFSFAPLDAHVAFPNCTHLFPNCILVLSLSFSSRSSQPHQHPLLCTFINLKKLLSNGLLERNPPPVRGSAHWNASRVLCWLVIIGLFSIHIQSIKVWAWFSQDGSYGGCRFECWQGFFFLGSDKTRLLIRSTARVYEAASFQVPSVCKKKKTKTRGKYYFVLSLQCIRKIAFGHM